MKSVYFRVLCTIVFLSLTTWLAACSNKQPKQDDPGPTPSRDLSSDQTDAGLLFKQARTSLEKGRFETAVAQYENLEATYPFGDHAAQARLDTAYASYRMGDMDSALSTLDRYLKLYPQSDQSDYAYYLKGLVNYSRGKSLFESFVPRKMNQLDQAWLRTALTDFATLERKFPESEFIEDAKARREQLTDHMAEHELSTARYYFSRSAMVATINRINYMMEQYPDNGYSADGLALLARAHRALGNKKSADEATATLRKKHPEFTKI